MGQVPGGLGRVRCGIVPMQLGGLAVEGGGQRVVPCMARILGAALERLGNLRVGAGEHLRSRRRFGGNLRDRGSLRCGCRARRRLEGAHCRTRRLALRGRGGTRFVVRCNRRPGGRGQLVEVRCLVIGGLPRIGGRRRDGSRARRRTPSGRRIEVLERIGRVSAASSQRRERGLLALRRLLFALERRRRPLRLRLRNALLRFFRAGLRLPSDGLVRRLAERDGHLRRGWRCRLHADLEVALRLHLRAALLQRRAHHQRQRRRRRHRSRQRGAQHPARTAPRFARLDGRVRVDPRGLDPERLHLAAHLDHLADVPFVLELRLRLGRRQDTAVEPRRGLLQLAERRGHLTRLVQRRLLRAALVAAGKVRLQLGRARRIQLAVREVEQQILGLGVRHALPNRMPGAGSSAAVSSLTPAAPRALRSPSSA